MAIAQAVLAALVHQARTGEGQVIEVPMLETMVAFNLLDHQRGHAFEPPIGDFGYDRLLTPYPAAVPHRRRLGRHPAVQRPALAASSSASPGEPDLADDPRFADHNARITHIADLYRLVDELAPTLTTGEWLARCEEASDPGHGGARPLPRPGRSRTWPPSGCSRWSSTRPRDRTATCASRPRSTRTPTGLHRHAPRLGEHTGEVLAEAGYGPAEIDDAGRCRHRRRSR